MFKLSSYYSIASLLGTGLVVLILWFFLRHLATQSLMEHQTRTNIDLTISLANSLLDDYQSFFEATENLSASEIKQRPEIDELQQLITMRMKGISVVKIKIYNINGLTIFSTDPEQIGNDKSKYSGFRQARSGTVASEISFRNEFSDFEGIIMDRNLIASYIPIKSEKNGPVIAVFEVYADVTPLLQGIEDMHSKILLIVFSSLAVLYLFLLVIVRRADKVLLEQDKDRQRNQEKIKRQAYRDALTGLPNRYSFEERIEEAFSRAYRHNKSGALMYLDLDRFKLINDSLGHDAGDKLLHIVADRIRENVRDADMAFRMSGDEFVIILEDLEKTEDASQVAERILQSMQTPAYLDEHELTINVSIGITQFPRDNYDIEATLKEADVAMYQAKEKGNNNIVYFKDGMNPAAYERLTLETELQHAINENEFVLHYQPKYKTNTYELVGLEALIRWQHPLLGTIPPNKFIPILEDMGKINAVGQWVLEEACSQARKWIDQGYSAIRMSVNISARQFSSDDLVNTVKRVLRKTGLAAEHLELELTESMFVEDTEHAISVMHDLKSLGVSLSIDDFGSGYSSLSYLKQFPVDYLKIDRTFIRDLTSNPKDASIITAISGLAQSLDLEVVAEGVEIQEQIDFLQETGCHELQGFFFQPALPANEVESLMRRFRNIAAN
ncbi:MAG: EAL domain-containing protein [Thioalkalispiraceae bacterium]